MRTEKTTPDGIEIIVREPAVGPHPNPSQNGRLVPFNGVTKVLLADGTEQHECDQCGKLFPKSTQVISHQAGAHTTTEKRTTTVETVKAVLRAVMRERAAAKSAGRKGYYREAADALNAAGVRTYHNKEWTAETVASLYARYKDVYKMRVRTSISRTIAAAPAALLDRPETEVEIEAQTIDPRNESLSDGALFTRFIKLIGDVEADVAELKVLGSELAARLESATKPANDLERQMLELLRSAANNG